MILLTGIILNPIQIQVMRDDQASQKIAVMRTATAVVEVALLPLPLSPSVSGRSFSFTHSLPPSPVLVLSLQVLMSTALATPSLPYTERECERGGHGGT